jgi:hypothetical protein
MSVHNYQGIRLAAMGPVGEILLKYLRKEAE